MHNVSTPNNGVIIINLWIHVNPIIKLFGVSKRYVIGFLKLVMLQVYQEFANFEDFFVRK